VFGDTISIPILFSSVIIITYVNKRPFFLTGTEWINLNLYNYSTIRRFLYYLIQGSVVQFNFPNLPESAEWYLVAMLYWSIILKKNLLNNFPFKVLKMTITSQISLPALLKQPNHFKFCMCYKSHSRHWARRTAICQRGICTPPTHPTYIVTMHWTHPPLQS